MALPADVFTQRQILFFWLPLAASWLLMSAEAPILQAAIARLPDMQTQLAAFGIVMSLEIAIESPVIMLLATSTALATNAHNYRVLFRFMVALNVLGTVVAFLAAFTPLFDLIVRGAMGLPEEIAVAVRPGMQIMTLWTAAIGVRRFLQGVLIRNGETRWVGYGTVLRLVSSAGTGISLALFTRLAGVSIGATALMAGVIVEALFAVCVSRPTVRRIVSGESCEDEERLGMADIVRYHAPLAATSLLMLMALPLIGAGLARMPHAEENLAALAVIWGIQFIFRSPAYALPEAVIALVRRRRLQEAVRKFCLRVGIVSSAGMALLALTPLRDLYLGRVAGLPEELAGYVAPGLVLALALPFLSALHSWQRGLLMVTRRTRVIYWGMGLNLLVTGALVGAGVILQTPGTPTAMLALTAALVVELVYLTRAGRQRNEAAPAP